MFLPGFCRIDGPSLPALNPDFLYAALDATAYAAFVKESRKKRAGATKLHRKSGKALLPRINAGAPAEID
jgi:hypothetical protein